MKGIVKKAGAALLVLAVLAGLQNLLIPKYTGRVIEGAFIKEYYQDEPQHDLLILGDCEVYENISPITLWEKYGITSYIRGSANQMVAQSYYLLEDTLRTETPKAVLFNVAAMQLGVQDKETYNRMTMEGMRWSPSKWNAIEATKLPEEHMIEYVFPLLRYHSRWSELEKADFAYYFKRPEVSHNGYYMRCDVRPAGEFPTERRKPSYAFPDVSWEYLDRMESLCRSKGIQLVLMKAPSLYPAWPEQYESQIEEYAQQHELLYINCLEALDEIGLDFSEDTYDAGLHLNLYGAEKLADYLGGKLSKDAGLSDQRGNAELSKLWEKKTNRYRECQAEQEEEFAALGYLTQFAGEEE